MVSNKRLRTRNIIIQESGTVNVSHYHYLTHIYRDLYLCSNLTLEKNLLSSSKTLDWTILIKLFLCT